MSDQQLVQPTAEEAAAASAAAIKRRGLELRDAHAFRLIQHEFHQLVVACADRQMKQPGFVANARAVVHPDLLVKLDMHRADKTMATLHATLQTFRRELSEAQAEAKLWTMKEEDGSMMVVETFAVSAQTMAESMYMDMSMIDRSFQWGQVLMQQIERVKQLASDPASRMLPLPSGAAPLRIEAAEVD